MNFNPPEEIILVANKLVASGYKAYLVGGCVRDILRKAVYGEFIEPKDWDVATDARPEEIQKIFPDSVYENKFGTVLVKLEPRINGDIDADKRGCISKNQRVNQQKSASLKAVEITTFRVEGKYTDKRHPDEIKFAKTIEEDLARRDFTINAMAIEVKSEKRKVESGTSSLFALRSSLIVDPFSGQEDIKNKIIRAVGNPEERFNEDALRLMRAVRFATELDFSIEEKTGEAIKKQSGLLEMIAKERIRDEFIKILMTKKAATGIQMLEDSGLLRYIAPELRNGIGVGQNKHHIYSVWEHNLRALNYAAQKKYSLEIRLAALLHDIGKPATKVGQGLNCTFYNHEIVSAKIAARILDRLHFPKDQAEKIIHLVRYHLFYYNVGEVSEAGVRRFLARVGLENVGDFIKLREADRIGSGVPKAVPYKIRHLLFMIEKVKQDPISPKMLKVNGSDAMKILGIGSGRRVGWILSVLLDEVIENPEKNTKENLELRIEKLGKLSDNELEKLSQSARERKEEFESGIEEEMKRKFYVK